MAETSGTISVFSKSRITVPTWHLILAISDSFDDWFWLDGSYLGNHFDHKLKVLHNAKGLVIFNPAVGGWSNGEGGQKYLDTCFRGVEFFF